MYFIQYVVSLCCRTDEGSRRKCGQYWPLEEGGQEVYGHMAVVNQRVDHHTHYNHTTLELHNTEVPLQQCVLQPESAYRGRACRNNLPFVNEHARSYLRKIFFLISGPQIAVVRSIFPSLSGSGGSRISNVAQTSLFKQIRYKLLIGVLFFYFAQSQACFRYLLYAKLS